MAKKILILFAHPAQHRSEVNAPLFDASKNHKDVTTVDLYHEYPTYHIDIDKEQQRLIEHDVIVFMFPLYWYSTPALLKEWQDLVLEYDFAYGQKGTSLHGKQFLCAISTGGPDSAYQADGFNQHTVRDLLKPLEQTANLCGMEYLPPFVLHGSRTAVEDKRVAPHIDSWTTTLDALTTGKIQLDSELQQANNLNDQLERLLGDNSK